jgi:hypothetical protein
VIEKIVDFLEYKKTYYHKEETEPKYFNYDGREYYRDNHKFWCICPLCSSDSESMLSQEAGEMMDKIMKEREKMMEKRKIINNNKFR